MLEPMLAAALLSANPLPLDEPAINYRAVALIQCGGSRGTAFWISDTVMVTAAHVTARGPCSISGESVTVTYENGNTDFALIRGPRNPYHIAVNCRGPREGRIYHAVGFAMGQYRHTSRLMASRERYNLDNGNGLRVMFGQVYPGQSGGPVVDREGRVVSIVNRGSQFGPPYMASRSLADTPLCGGRA